MRTSFHILLSGLAFTDFCTGLIAQPFYASMFFIYSTNSSIVQDIPLLLAVIQIIGVGSAIFFVTITILSITVYLVTISISIHIQDYKLN